MFRKFTLVALSCLALATVASAQDGCPMRPDGNDVETRAVSFRSIADAYGIANGHYLIGTADTALPSPIVDPACGVNGTTIGSALYLGDLEIGGTAATGNGNDMIGVAVFNSNEIVGSARKHAIRFRSIQNFVGNAYTLTAKILENRGDVLGTPGARGLFNRTPVLTGTNATAGGMGPFGAPNAGVLSTVVTDTRSDRSDLLDGACTMPALGTLNVHDSGSGVTYATFDLSADIQLGSGSSDPGLQSVKGAIEAAQASGVSYTTCRFSCTTPSPLIRNSSCDLVVTNPLYVGITAVSGGSSTAAGRLQDTLLVDNILHVMGDTDFCGEAFVGEICGITFVSKL
jgi:hypothetical protein